MTDHSFYHALMVFGLLAASARTWRDYGEPVRDLDVPSGAFEAKVKIVYRKIKIILHLKVGD